MKERIESFVAAAAALFGVLVLAYVLTAPPVMASIARQKGDASFPGIYQPIVKMIESDFNGPLLWYFNDVWHSEIVVIGEGGAPPRVIALYALAGCVLLGAIVFPFVRRRLRCRKQYSAV